MLLFTLGGVAVTAIGIAIIVGLVLFLLFLLKLSFRNLPAKSDGAAKPEQAASATADVE